ncbi:MAG TPA: DegT/DnrJ/EryC1/StrS family aminotransferase [Acidisarcina sp.]
MNRKWSSPAAPWPRYEQDEIDAVERVLRSGKVNYWTGEEGRLFEQEFAAASGCAYGIALANGTIALELALRTLGIGPGDEVITTARTFIASASCAALVGARPVLVDVDRVSQNLTAETIAPAITERTRAIIAVHLNGWPCDMEPILALAASRGIAIIEDCSQAHGATYKGRPVGSMGAIGTFSFCQDKIMTTGGEGGMAITNDAALQARIWALKDHGKSMGPSGAGGGRHDSFGSNGRMTEMQAAIGRVQLRKLPEWVAARQRNAAVLDAALKDLRGLRLTIPPAESAHAYYRYTVFVEQSQLRQGWSRDRIVAAISDAGVPCFSWSNGDLSLEKAFAAFPQPDLPVARELSETSVIFLVHPTFTESDMHSIAHVVRSVMKQDRHSS